MIWGINGAAVRAGKLPMAFVFTNNNNERILFAMVIKPAEGAAAEGAMDHSAMDPGSTETGAEKAAPDAAQLYVTVPRPSQPPPPTDIALARTVYGDAKA